MTTQPLKGRGRTNVVSVLQLLCLELLRAEDEFRGPALRLCWGNFQEQKKKDHSYNSCSVLLDKFDPNNCMQVIFIRCFNLLRSSQKASCSHVNERKNIKQRFIKCLLSRTFELILKGLSPLLHFYTFFG